MGEQTPIRDETGWWLQKGAWRNVRQEPIPSVCSMEWHSYWMCLFACNELIPIHLTLMPVPKWNSKELGNYCHKLNRFRQPSDSLRKMKPQSYVTHQSLHKSLISVWRSPILHYLWFLVLLFLQEKPKIERPTSFLFCLIKKHVYFFICWFCILGPPWVWSTSGMWWSEANFQESGPACGPEGLWYSGTAANAFTC